MKDLICIQTVIKKNICKQSIMENIVMKINQIVLYGTRIHIIMPSLNNKFFKKIQMIFNLFYKYTSVKIR